MFPTEPPAPHVSSFVQKTFDRDTKAIFSNVNSLNPIFSDRVQERIRHEDVVQAKLPKKEHPDRVYGLRKTENIGRALARASDRLIDFSPFDPAVDPLVFPFLILEAKSNKSSEGWDDVEKQTAFPIRTLIKLQEDLQGLC